MRVAVGEFVRAVRFAERAADPEGLSASTAAMLAAVERGRRPTISEVAAALAIRHQSAGGMIGELVRSGLLARSTHETDSRAVLVELTSAGRTALGRHRFRRTRLIDDAAAAALGEGDRAVLAAMPAVIDKLTAQIRT